MSTAVTTIPAGPVRSVPWRRLAWVTWRRLRTTILSTVGLLGLLGLYLLVSGLQVRSAWSDVQACAPRHSSTCDFALQNFRDAHSNPGILGVTFIFAPLLIGAFTGAPLVGRELETGTFRYAWTQGVSRTRWAIAMLVPGAAVVAILTGAFGVLITWHDQPLWQADISERLGASEFPATGVAIIGWGLAAYAVGVLAGYLWRRVIPALATAVATTFGLAYAASRLRLHYLPAHVTDSLDYVPGSQTIGQWWERAGAHVSTADLNAALQSAGLGQIQTGGSKTGVSAQAAGQGADPVSYLLHHGFTQWTSFQPAGRYWSFQWIEFGWLATIATILLAATVLLIRHRDA